MTDPDSPPVDAPPPASPARVDKNKSPAHKASKAKAPRRRARELALQGLYASLVSGSDAASIEATLREENDFAQADSEHFDALLHGCMADAAALDALLVQHIDRKVTMLSPVEHAALWIGTYELQRCVEIPYRVVINEAVELAKSFGGTDGHRYVNGVLDKLAAQLRPVEHAAAPRRAPAGKPAG